MKLKVSEADVQKTILEYLHLKNHAAWRINTGGVAKWGKDKQFAGFRPSPQKGISDILGIKGTTGQFFAIECKASSGGKLSDEQNYFLGIVRGHGGIGIVARSIDDVQQAGL